MLSSPPSATPSHPSSSHPDCFLLPQAWRPGVTIKQILLGVQDLLDTPNPLSPAQEEAYRIFQKDKAEYERRVKAQVKQYTTDKYIGGS